MSIDVPQEEVPQAKIRDAVVRVWKQKGEATVWDVAEALGLKKSDGSVDGHHRRVRTAFFRARDSGLAKYELRKEPSSADVAVVRFRSDAAADKYIALKGCGRPRKSLAENANDVGIPDDDLTQSKVLRLTPRPFAAARTPDVERDYWRDRAKRAEAEVARLNAWVERLFGRGKDGVGPCSST